MKIKTLLPVLFCILLSGCFPKVLQFTPIPCEKFKDCKNNIEKAYLSQRKAYVPAYIKVTDEAIFFDKDESSFHGITGATTVHSKRTALYFDKIEKLRLVDDNTRRFEIRFYYVPTKETHTIFLYDKELGIEGYSALKCMIEKAKAKAQSKEYY